MSSEKPRSVIVIGAGIAGLSAGIYAQRCGYRSRIYEMHTLPGGLMTSWKRKGFTIDGCVQWLMSCGSSTSSYPLYQEVGLTQGRQFYYPEVFFYFEDRAGRPLVFYADIGRLEKSLLEISPEDSALIRRLCRAARSLVGLNPPVSGSGDLMRMMASSLRSLPSMISAGPTMLSWKSVSMGELGSRFRNPFLREAFSTVWLPQMSVLTLLFTMAFTHSKINPYPVGGSLQMARAVERRYCELGGEIHFGARVKKILVRQDRAVGIQFEDGSEELADHVISAADGHATIWDMLEGRYVDDTIRRIYEEFPLFKSLVLVSLGVHRTFPDLPKATGGALLMLKQPLDVAGESVGSLKFTVYNFDPTLAPEGRTVIKVRISSPFGYWKELVKNRPAYDAEKDRIARDVIQRLDQRFPGLSDEVEMVDVATPVTFERYTGNWQASFEGFLPTPKTMTASIPLTLPGLENLHMAGQWVRVGGGIPTGVATGREAIIRICRKDGVKFQGA